MINVDATADMTGRYQKGGNGFEDYLRLSFRTMFISDFTQGARMNFGAGQFGDNSAFITNFGGVGSGLNFDVDGWGHYNLLIMQILLLYQMVLVKV